jgi:hypothetical protein
MKRVLIGVVIAGLALAAAVAPAWCQDNKVGFSLNAGVQTNVWNGSSFDKAVFTLDGRVGIALGKAFEISPEFMYVFNYASYFDMSGGSILYPGVMLNYKMGKFFVGFGLVLPWAFFEGDNETGNIAPKINVGYRFGKLQMTAYMITWTEEGVDFLDVNWVGLTLGYRF